MNKEECIDIINPPYLSIRGDIICSLDDFKKYAIDLQAENTKLKQEKKELKEWLEEEIKTLDKLDERFGKGLLELVLVRLGE